MNKNSLNRKKIAEIEIKIEIDIKLHRTKLHDLD